MNRSPLIHVVEGDREIRTMISRLLPEQSYRVTVGEDGRSMDKALGGPLGRRSIGLHQFRPRVQMLPSAP